MAKASTVLLLLAVVAAILAPIGLFLQPSYWLGLPLIFGALAWVLRAFRTQTAPEQSPDFEKHGVSSEEALEALRLEKDRFFRRSPDSPFPIEVRASFPGLRYFPLDTDAVFK